MSRFLNAILSQKKWRLLLHRQAPGLKPCSVGSRSHNAIGKIAARCNKSTKNRGSHPTASFMPALVLMTKEKKAFQKRAASVTWPLRAMPAHV